MKFKIGDIVNNKIGIDSDKLGIVIDMSKGRLKIKYPDIKSVGRKSLDGDGPPLVIWISSDDVELNVQIERDRKLKELGI